MKDNLKARMAQYVKDNCADIIFSIESVKNGIGGDVHRGSANSIFAQWVKYGGIVVAGSYPRTQGGSPHKLFRIVDMDIIVPRLSRSEIMAERTRAARDAEKKKEIEDAVIGLRINHFALGVDCHV